MKHLGLALTVIVLVACNRNTYDSGDGNYSYLCADFVEAHTNNDLKADYVIIDEGDTLSMSNPFTNKNFKVRDSLYRGALYYNRESDDNDNVKISPVSYSPIPVIRVVPNNDSLRYDPMDFESMWCSKTGKYLNVSLIFKTGQVNGSEGMHAVYLTKDSNIATFNGRRRLHLTFSHNQNGVPEYYTARQYVSIPLKQFATELHSGDSIAVSVKTYDGWVQKCIEY